MLTNIELCGLNSHFFLKDSIKKEDKKREKYKTKIVKYEFYSVNEAQISEKIKVLPNYTNKFAIVDNYESINISQLNQNYIEKLNLNDKTRYLVFNYKNMDFIHFNDFLFQFNSIKLLIFNIIESFSHLLTNLYELNEINICFFNLCPLNIVFLREKPLLCNFQHSIQISKLNESYFTKIIDNLDDFYIYKPLEVHVIFYLIKNDLNTISYSFIEEICEIYTNNLTVLQFFSQKYVESYKKACIETLKPFINKNKGEIIEDLLQYINSWDLYSLSVLYVHIIGNILQLFSLKDTFISKIFLELSKNIHPNPSNRYDLDSMREIFNKLFNEEKCWKYINNLKNTEMSKLLENI